jgi:hypothetical protein
MEPNGFPVPEWEVSVTNRFIFYVFDRTSARLVDFVSLSSLSHGTNILEALRAPTADMRLLWDTNRLGSSVLAPTAGVQEQIDISLGACAVSVAYWRAYGGSMDKSAAIQALRDFVDGDPYLPNPPTNLVMAVGFTPTVRLYLTSTWQANDPLVHNQAPDLVGANPTNTTIHCASYLAPRLFPSDFPYNLGRLNSRHQPWPASPDEVGNDPERYNLAVQDPLVRASEDWDFPEGQPLDPTWLGRVHRGTP